MASVFANADSALWRYPNPDGVPGWSPVALTQEERGQRYAAKVQFLYDAATPAGIHPVAGVKFWSWGDHWGEKVNFGLVSFSDNAYDGQEAVVNRGTDPWGWPTGGEERNYGDFLSAVVDINTKISRWLVEASPGGSDPNAPPCADCLHYTGTLTGPDGVDRSYAARR